MKRIPIATASLACAALLLLGCGDANTPATSPSDEPADSPAETPSESALPEPVVLTAEEAYQRACALCHDQGINGAPTTGKPDTWSGRSTLWEAVAFEHAAKGYLSMPAGGANGLNDDTIAQAAEYMLEKTFTDAPAD